MKAKYLGSGLLAALMTLASCNDFLDINPTDKVTKKIVWENPAYAEMVINNYYGYIPNLGPYSDFQCTAGLTEGLTDELKYGNMNYNSLCFIPNEISYGGVVLSPNYVNVYMGVWESAYESIRRVNESLSDLADAKFGDADKKRFEGELRFFRGMLYFELQKRYGQSILYTADLSQINTNKALSSEADCWKFVYDDLKFAAENLPKNTSATGRLTSGAAWAMMSRAMLYAKNWAAVKEAGDAIFQMGYKLADTYPEAFLSGNSEAIFQYTYDAASSITHSFDSYYAPGGDHTLAGLTSNTGGYGTPTQDMVEEYELATGGKANWNPWHTPTGTTTAPPYDQLEPRFKATILYNGAAWRNRTIEPFVGGADGWSQWQVEPKADGRTTTGYYLRKLVDEKHDYPTLQASTQPYIAFRLAEVYLNYAEACFRLGDNAKAMNYINKVRTRVGLPKVSGLSGDGLFDALRHERKVELAFEGLYYWDMRRWNMAATQFTGVRRHGLKVEKQANGTFKYTYVNVDNENLNFPAKMYRLPIPTAELNNNKELSQFAEWK